MTENQTSTEAKSFCQYGFALYLGIGALQEDIALQQDTKPAGVTVETLAIDKTVVANKERLNNALDALEACDVCHGDPMKLSSGDFTCPMALQMVKDRVSVVKVANPQASKL